MGNIGRAYNVRHGWPVITPDGTAKEEEYHTALYTRKIGYFASTSSKQKLKGQQHNSQLSTFMKAYTAYAF